MQEFRILANSRLQGWFAATETQDFCQNEGHGGAGMRESRILAKTAPVFNNLLGNKTTCAFAEKVMQSASDIMSALLVEIAGKVPMGGC